MRLCWISQSLTLLKDSCPLLLLHLLCDRLLLLHSGQLLLPPLEGHLLPGRVPVELGKVVHHDGDWQCDDQDTRDSSTGT